MSAPGRAIEVVGAHTHNLRGVDCSFPHYALSVVTGVSGSGKSSLAFDTVYAEGQRRYVETLPTYTRQFLAQMRKPPVTAVRNVPPALALRQGSGAGGARSSVGSVTEIVDHLHLLYAGAGETTCKACGSFVQDWTVPRVIDWLVAEADKERILVVGTIVPEEGTEVADLLRQLAADGHRRLYDQGALIDMDSADVTELLGRGALRVVLDRLSVSADSSRLAEAIEAAYRFGERVTDVVLWDRREGDAMPPEQRFYDHHRCRVCDTMHQPPIPALFDTQSTIGACDTCGGFGRTVGIDHAKVIPDPRRTLEDDAVACFTTPSMRKHQRRLISECERAGVPTNVAWFELDDDAHRFVMHGDGRYRGIEGFFADLEEDRYKPHIRILIARYRGYAPCVVCEGSGLSPDARAVRVGGRHLGRVLQLRVEDARGWLAALALPAALAEALKALLLELDNRLQFLEDAGVGYLTLDRAARTLSGGEMHRVLLATSLGRMLTDTCYVLDEPTAGLHPHDTARLLKVIERLRDVGNTVIVVEHDPDVILRAEHIVELGPAGGDLGGRVTYEGGVAGLAESDTATGEMLRRRAPTLVAAVDASSRLEVEGACLHNLRDVRVGFPHGALSVVTGVSGSGKSTLIHDVLYAKLQEARGQRSETTLGPTTVRGDVFDEIVMVDQGAIARSTRSCAMTLSGAYTPIRELFAGSAYASMNGLTPGHFSFNTPGGRCDRCEGTGTVAIEMHFVADVELVCDVCEGRRFQDHVLAATYEGHSIADVFEMTIAEAIRAFGAHASIARKLEPLERVGLGYIKLGQSTSQMSGGELQRVKLASYVGKAGRSRSHRLFLFDEPTVGLHLRDVDRLLGALRELVAEGNTVIVVEHNLDLIAACDWIVDLGPGPGVAGGRVVYEGPAAGILNVSESLTGDHLRALVAS